MEHSNGVNRFGIAIIVYGVLNLVGSGSYKQFVVMFKTLPGILTVGLYIFSIFYSICCVYCGIKIRKYENWARQLIVILTAISVTVGLFVNRVAMSNLKVFLSSEASQIPPEMVHPVYIYSVVATALFTIFELCIIYFFTRPKVVDQFRSE